MFSSSDILLNDLLNHNERVSKISLSLCRALNLSEKITHDISKAAIFHDIGKLFIPDEVLHKPSPLNSIEFEIIKMHSTYSYEILKSHNYKENLLR